MDFPANLSHWTLWIDAGTIVAVAFGVAKTFDWFDGLIGDRGRAALWYYMADVASDDRMESWSAVFPRLIDRVFGAHALSFKFFFRSYIASVVSILIVTMISFRVYGGNIFYFVSQTGAIQIALLALAANGFPDYLSLLISRTILRVMEKYPTVVSLLSLLLFDAVLTAILATVSFAIAMAVLSTFADSWITSNLIPVDFQTVIFKLKAYSPLDILQMLTGRYEVPCCDTFLPDSAGRVFFFGSFFTSAWVWLYVLSIFNIKLAQKVRPLWLKLLPYLDVEKKPMQAIGRIAGIMAGMGYAVILWLVWAVHHWR